MYSYYQYIPRKLYNKRTKNEQARACGVKFNTYSDDGVAMIIIPTEETDTNRADQTEKNEDDSLPDEKSTKKRIQKISDFPIQKTLHAKLMNELHERFLAMQTDYDL